MAVAIVTGGSRGLGEVLAGQLAARGWSVVIDARDQSELARTAQRLIDRVTPPGAVVAVAGDVTDPVHRRALVAAAERLGGVDLLVNNASILGAVPLPNLANYPLEALRQAYEVNVVAPLALLQEALPLLRRSSDPRVLDLTSDASVEAYPGWGGYGSSKAALDHLGAVLGAEEPDLRIWSVDPGDMRTRMHQEAFPGEDISDRPLPESVAPALMALIEEDRPSGRYRAAELSVMAS
jgi:NAD(P)-dependent dehydrogenase (short-subunit alcohol dehydrogenase family)